MVILNRKVPITLKKLQALIPRLRPDFPRIYEIKQDERNRRKGYEGEKHIDYYIELLADKFTILHDVCLEVNKRIFQMDSIIISKKAIYIIEMKDYSNKITFDTNLNQCIRSDGDIEMGYRHPIAQAENQKLLLETWLEQNFSRHIPVRYFVVFSDPNTMIDVIGDKEAIAEIVLHANHLPNKVLNIDNEINNTMKQKSHLIGKRILKENKDFEIDILKEYQISRNDILSGVQCPKCQTLGMKRGHGKWICMRCKSVSKQAHLKALSDYLILINPYISNKECMRLLNVSSKDVTTRILKSSNLMYDPLHRRWKK